MSKAASCAFTHCLSRPGLLGSAKQFETRFGKPIQRDADPTASAQLRNLIAPFVLRRRKSEVLRELPSRTEITVRVEPARSEQAFSEALRRDALRRLQESGGTRAGSAISILAEITRLRRAACHPQLVDIGQERPVTIYRLVNAASIEERVLSLHERKRALAEELLRDSGEAARLDPKTLMSLLEGA